MTTIPTPPTFADITLPTAPTISLPTLDVDSVTEPVLNDPTCSLRAFAYSRYASAINSLLNGKIEELLTWEGDDELFKAQTGKAQDQIMGKLLNLHNQIFSGAAARGFLHLPGEAKKAVAGSELEARLELQAAGVQTQGELTNVALQFLGWAAEAGTDQVRIGVDENKQIVYANMSAVEGMAGALVDLRKQQLQVFDGKVKLYNDALAAVNVETLQNEVLLSGHEGDVEKAILAVKRDGLIIDEQHAANLGTAISNAENLLTASECLQNAELEKVKVLQSHAVLAGFLAKIKEAHAQLIKNRAEVDTELADLDIYKSQAELAEQGARNALTILGGLKDELNAQYQKEMAYVKISRASLQNVETGLDGVQYDTKTEAEKYRKQLKEFLVNDENADLLTLSNNAVAIDSWVAEKEATLNKRVAKSAANHTANVRAIRGVVDKGKNALEGCAKDQWAEWTAKQDTTLNLSHNIL